jgi:hypothetical protein
MMIGFRAESAQAISMTVPIETLAMGRKDYDPYAEVTKMLEQLRTALAATAR